MRTMSKAGARAFAASTDFTPALRARPIAPAHAAYNTIPTPNFGKCSEHLDQCSSTDAPFRTGFATKIRAAGARQACYGTGRRWWWVLYLQQDDHEELEEGSCRGVEAGLCQSPQHQLRTAAFVFVTFDACGFIVQCSLAPSMLRYMKHVG